MPLALSERTDPAGHVAGLSLGDCGRHQRAALGTDGTRQLLRRQTSIDRDHGDYRLTVHLGYQGLEDPGTPHPDSGRDSLPVAGPHLLGYVVAMDLVDRAGVVENNGGPGTLLPFHQRSTRCSRPGGGS